MLKTSVVSLLFALCALPTFSQKYTTAAGVRLGSGIGVTVQQHIIKKLTIEGIVQKNLFKSGTNVTVLLEHHYPIAFKAFNFYLGAGPHAEFTPNVRVYDEKGNSYLSNNNGFGVTAIGGVELRLKNLLLSYDYQPGLNIHGGEHVFNSRTGVSLRYILIKPAKKEKNWMFWKKWEK